MSKKKPVPGHKCEGVRMWVSVSCECGWSSSQWGMGKGARASAYSEWRDHAEHCADATEEAALDAALNCK